VGFPVISEIALETIRREFADNFVLRGEVGASLSIWTGDTEICSLHAGFRDRDRSIAWDDQTIVPIWSATKGPAAATVLLALHESALTPDSPIGELWPELGCGTLAGQAIGDLLSHQCGLSGLDEPAHVFDHDAVVAALENQRPIWTPGDGHGYHPRTFGFLADELVRRAVGVPLAEFWRARIADPLGLHLWIGLPEAEDHRVAELLTPRPGTDPASMEFYRALGKPGSLSATAFASPRGLGGIPEMNRPETRRLSLPGFGGIGSASALARFYAILANGGLSEGVRILPEEITRWASATRTEGLDRILLAPTTFSSGFMKNSPAFPTGAFGHPGAGGSHAFADPSRGIGFAYVMNQMERSVFPTEKALSLVRALQDR